MTHGIVCNSGTNPAAAALYQGAVDATGRKPVAVEKRIAGQPGYAADDQHVPDDAGQGVLVDDALSHHGTNRGVFLVVQMEFFDRARRIFCRDDECAAGPVIDNVVRNMRRGEHECPVGATLPIATFIYDAQVIHRSRVTTLR